MLQGAGGVVVGIYLGVSKNSLQEGLANLLE